MWVKKQEDGHYKIASAHRNASTVIHLNAIEFEDLFGFTFKDDQVWEVKPRIVRPLGKCEPCRKADL